MGTFKQSSDGSTAERPSSPDIGWTHFNTTTNVYEVYDGADWQPTGNIADMTIIGTHLLMGAFGTTGSIVVGGNNSQFAGVSFSVAHPATGQYTITTSGLSAVTNVTVLTQVNSNVGGDDITLKVEAAAGGGFPSPSGFKIRAWNSGTPVDAVISFNMFSTG